MKVTSAFLLATAIFLCLACRKDEKVAEEEQVQLAQDESFLSRETDQALDDANDVLTASRYGDGSSTTVCGVQVDSTQISSGKIVLNFDGSTCLAGTRKREGKITLTVKPVGARWRDAGTKVSLTFDQYKVTRVSDGKSIVLNGTKSITNTSGGLIIQLTALSSPVVHSVRADLRVDFEDGTSRLWKVARKRTVSYTSGNYLVELQGDTTVGGYSFVSVWGTSRKGTVFYVNTESPLQYSSLCFRRAKDGTLNLYTIYNTFTVKFGVDESGLPDQGVCPYGYKVEWTDAENKEQTKVIPYR